MVIFYRQIKATAGCFSDCGFIDMIKLTEVTNYGNKKDTS